MTVTQSTLIARNFAGFNENGLVSRHRRGRAGPPPEYHGCRGREHAQPHPHNAFEASAIRRRVESDMIVSPVMIVPGSHSRPSPGQPRAAHSQLPQDTRDRDVPTL
jgi:hypothetical protein